MKWYILVTMLGLFSDGTQDIYIYYNPVLPTLQACQEYVYIESNRIRQDMHDQFNGKTIDKVFCIEEEKLRKFLETSQKPGIET